MAGAGMEKVPSTRGGDGRHERGADRPADLLEGVVQSRCQSRVAARDPGQGRYRVRRERETERDAEQHEAGE